MLIRVRAHYKPSKLESFFPLSLMAATTTASEAVASGSLKCKTWVLKVSIHCQGCKREVKKALQKLEGVYKISVDSQQHKVTVTGNINSEALLNKLTRIGKHAEIFSENTPSKPKPEKGEKQNVLRAPSGELVNNNGNGGQRNTRVNFAAAQAADTSRKTTTSNKNSNPNPDGKVAAKINKESNAASGGDKGTGQAKVKGQKGNFQKKGNGIAPPRAGSMKHQQQSTNQGVDEEDLSPKGSQSQITVANPTAEESVSCQEIMLSYNSTHHSRGGMHDLYHEYIPSQPAVYTDAEQLKTIQGHLVQDQGHLVQEQGQERASSMNSFDIFNEENANGCSIM